MRNMQTEAERLSQQVHQQLQVIESLEAERVSLGENLTELHSSLSLTRQALQSEQQNSTKLQEQVQSLDQALHEYTEQVEQQQQTISLLVSEKASLTSAVERLEYTESALEEAEKRLQDELSKSANSRNPQEHQDRADEVEFQLSKLRQAHDALQRDRETLDNHLQKKTAAEADWQARHAEVERQHAAVQEQLSPVIAERDSLLGERTALQTEVEGHKHIVAGLEQKLAALAADVTAGARQLKQTQAELKASTARAEDAERMQKELQTEGIGLMRSLDEMRPKIVELTDEKLRLSERMDSLEKTVANRDAIIAHLEGTIEDAKDEMAAVQRERRAHCRPQTGGDAEGDRTKLRAAVVAREDELRRLSADAQAQAKQLAALRAELAEQADAQAEASEFLARAQADAEALRADAAQKDAELERLRDIVASPTAGPGAGPSLDDEMLSALRQQHALELSAAHSKVRALESAVYDAEAKMHAHQRRAAALEGELAEVRAQPLALPRRTSSRQNELRRASIGSGRPARTASPPPPATLAAFEGLSPEARHKRKVSLSMLKARIDSELAASAHPPRAGATSSPRRKVSGLPVVVEPPEVDEAPHSHDHTHQHAHNGHSISHKRPVFMDESHIFWCHCCQGDLVVL
ncbi:uncharacterized protein BXZ73DRAFT_80145 [Epithele typhae]|uniref:uncharacterized protein n=1 Tax=Epithele typhae TaxID=378194 RepID=UPI002007C0A6|nr:uncharacterized protein BXZ73DRAFT_80145 [Epithele typhae]KAH9920189.1 hypothetical protein BXZ73DRAFT_80145 [Epithele typhae]